MNEESTTADAMADSFAKMDVFQLTASATDSLRAVHESAALVAAPGWALIGISGKDAADYLHRRLAQSVKDLEIGRGRQALQLSGDGRMECDLLLYRRGETDFVALADRASAASAVEILGKYVLMDEVEVGGEWTEKGSLVILGARASEVLERWVGGAVRDGVETGAWVFVRAVCDGVPVEVFRDGRWSVPCFQIVVPAGSLSETAGSLADETKKQSGAVISADEFNYARIENGVTQFGLDTNGKTLPLEANLRPALDLNKGCFPGQEFLARINNLGHPAHVLARLRFDDGVGIAAGDLVTGMGDDPGAGGTVTSAQTLEGVKEGVALATLPWKMRELKNAKVETKAADVTAAVELLGEYHDARVEAK